VLPTLFPWLMRDFGLTFTEGRRNDDGFSSSVSGIGQALAALSSIVSGALRVLYGGIALLAIAAFGIGIAPKSSDARRPRRPLPVSG
jgi:MFS family permease